MCSSLDLDCVLYFLFRLEDSNEGRFMGRINPEIMAAHISKVRGLRQEIEEELRRLMVHLSDEGDLAKHRPRVSAGAASPTAIDLYIDV